MKITKKYKISWIASLLLSPISILSIFFLFWAFTVGNMFTLNFTATNKTDSSIQVTPFGHFKNEPEYLSLSLTYWYYPSFIRMKQSNITIHPGESKVFHYDADNLYLNGFLIQTNNASKILEFERVADNSDILIGDIQHLPDISEELEIKLTEKSYILLFYLIWLLGLINAFILFKTYRNRKRITVHNTG